MPRPDFVQHPISGRAHLLDIARHVKEHNLPPLEHFTESDGIPLSYLTDCVTESGVSIQPGDILLVRTGFMDALMALPEKEQNELLSGDTRPWSGVQPSEEVMRWHWDKGIAAVVTDG